MCKLKSVVTLSEGRNHQGEGVSQLQGDVRAATSVAAVKRLEAIARAAGGHFEM